MEPFAQPADTLTNRISFYHLVLLLALLPFDRFYSELVLVSFALHTLIHVKKTAWKKIRDRRLLLLQSVYLLTVFSTLYSRDQSQAFIFWGRQLAICLFPMLLLLN